MSTPDLIVRQPIPADIEEIVAWRNDRYLTQSLAAVERRWEKADVENWIARSCQSDEQRFYIIADASDNAPVGFARLMFIDWDSFTAEIGFAIGRGTNHGKGYGTRGLELLLGKAFEKEKLRRVHLKVASDNHAAIRLYESVGFVREGTLRKHFLRGTDSIDMVLYGLLVSEWKSHSPKTKQTEYE